MGAIRYPKPGGQTVESDQIHLRLVPNVLELRPPSPLQSLERAPRIGLCRTPLWSTAQSETMAAFEDAAERLAKAGAQVTSVTLAKEFSGLHNAARETINNYERAAAMAQIQTPEQARERQKFVRQKVLELIGAIPEYSGPLHARITGRKNGMEDLWS